MSASERISGAFSQALCLPLNGNSKYILFSDCHRGVGNNNDNFLRNEFLYAAALEAYFRRGFTYIELGDGDELWENRRIRQIKNVHKQSFEILAKYHRCGRLYMIYGNHDIVKRDPRFAAKHFQSYYCDMAMCERPLCPEITFCEGIILRDQRGKRDIYLTHGHQADLWNSTFWRLSRFLVRYVWRPLEKLGVSDPTSAAKNHHRKKASEQVLSDWARERGHLLVAGHTHHPMAGTRDAAYFNTGSCIHPGAITGIEVENRCLTLVKWSLSVREDMSLCASREQLSEAVCIDDMG